MGKNIVVKIIIQAIARDRMQMKYCKVSGEKKLRNELRDICIDVAQDVAASNVTLF